jgi:hypothetical protein
LGERSQKVNETDDPLPDIKLARQILRGLESFGSGMTATDKVVFLAAHLNKARSMAYSDGFRDGIKKSDMGDKK